MIVVGYFAILALICGLCYFPYTACSVISVTGYVWGGAASIGWASVSGWVVGVSTCLPRGSARLVLCLCAGVATPVCCWSLGGYPQGGRLKKSPFVVRCLLHIVRSLCGYIVSGGLSRSVQQCHPSRLCQLDDGGRGSIIASYLPCNLELGAGERVVAFSSVLSPDIALDGRPPTVPPVQGGGRRSLVGHV
jgi:hypothetical protein